MTGNRPFTLIAALIFALMALIHLYRIATHFQIILGNHPVPMWVSYCALVVSGLLAVMLFRESRR
jgi:hypothetical protein